MNALAIDCAVSRLTISAKKDEKIVAVILDIGMKQSESLVPTIDYVLEKIELSPAELDYTVLTNGPGSFTGLRLAISAVKSINLAYNIPVYGISSLETYAYPFKDLDFALVSCIDAKKERFYLNISQNNSLILEDGDYEIPFILEKLSNFKEIFICGPDCKNLQEIIKSNLQSVKTHTLNTNCVTTESLFMIAEEKIKNGIPPLNDYDGPIYLRASEAEVKLNQ